MKTTQDGFVYQARQDEHFEQLECFADFVFESLLAAVKQRTLTEQEHGIICRAADLVNANHIYRVAGARLQTSQGT